MTDFEMKALENMKQIAQIIGLQAQALKDIQEIVYNLKTRLEALEAINQVNA